MRTVAVDFETFYIKPTQSNPGYSVSNLGNWRYCNDPRFDAYMVSVFDGEESWVGHPRDLNWEALADSIWLSHNAGFDSAVHARLVELGIVPGHVMPREWNCTANMTSYLCNRRSLAEASEHLLKVKVSKSARDWMNKKTWADAIAGGMAETLTEYARGDVIHCWNLYDKFGVQWTPTERALSELTIRQCRRGVAIDVEKLKRYTATVHMVMFHLTKSLPWVAEGEKVTSTKAINEQCRREGIPCPPVKSLEGGEEAFIEWEATYSNRFPWVKNVGVYRSINKVLTTLETIAERLRPDGTIDFSLLYFGAHTGRWSGGGGGLNMQNLRKDPIYVFDDYSIDDTGQTYTADEIKELGIREVIEMRSLFIPRPGYQFVICDLAQIEPRVLNWLCGNFELLERLRGGMSIYEAHARDTMGWTGGELKKENKVLYQTAKARVLGLGYGCGSKKFKVVAKTLADLDISDEESQRIVDDFRGGNEKIVDMWGDLDTKFKRSRGRDFEIELPSGRVLRYGSVREERRPYNRPAPVVPAPRAGEIMIADKGGIEWKTVYTADVGGTRRILYGGLFAENVTQAVSRDVFGEHLLALDRNTIPVVFHAHDEAITEVPEGTDKREVEWIMSQTPEWLKGCPIAAEAVVAKHYLK